jgi:hypothetical protein
MKLKNCHSFNIRQPHLQMNLSKKFEEAESNRAILSTTLDIDRKYEAVRPERITRCGPPVLVSGTHHLM